MPIFSNCPMLKLASEKGEELNPVILKPTLLYTPQSNAPNPAAPLTAIVEWSANAELQQVNPQESMKPSIRVSANIASTTEKWLSIIFRPASVQ